MALSSKESNIENWCSTHNKVIKLNCKWIIHNFSLYEYIEEWNSPTFSSKVYDEYKFSLRLKYESPHFNIFLSFTYPMELVQRKFKYKFSILKENQAETYSTSSFIRVNETTMVNYFILGCHASNILNKDNKLLPQDKLTIYFEIITFSKYYNIMNQSIIVPKSTLLKDLDKLFQNEKLADVTLVAGGKEFKAHKNILAARCIVFAAMFEHPMEESLLNRVEITDIEPEVLHELLRFIYTDKVANLDEIAKFLLAAADKYDIEILKKMCENSLSARLSIDTAVETLILADCYSAIDLRANTLVFINAKAADVMKTQDWKNMIKTHPNLIDEVLAEILVLEAKQSSNETVKDETK